MGEFLARLKQRKLVQWALAYVAFAFALIQVIDVVAQRFAWPDQLERILILALAIGFFLVIVLAWYHGERGAQRVTGTELLILALLLAIGGGFLWRFARVTHATSNASLATSTAPGSAVTRSPAAAQPNPGSALLTGAAAIPAKSVAVLPFVNMSGDPKNDYFSDGITEEILDALAQIPNLKVAARTSAFAFKGKAEDLRKVGEVLDVATVLEGSVQRSGDEVRITAQLIDTRTGYHLWSEKYDRKLTSIFAVEDEISKAITDRLKLQWNGNRPLVRNGTRDMQAHALYLQAIAAIAARGAALKRAAALLEQATARDPGYVAAWAQLSQAQELLPWYEQAPWQDSLDQAERAARHALAIDGHSAEAHAALANVLRDRFAFGEAAREYQRSLELNPGLSEVHNQYGQLLDAIGMFDAAAAQERIAIAQDPLAPNPQYMLGLLFDTERRHDEASAAFERVIRIAPRYVYAYDQLVFSRIYAGDYAQARVDVAATVGKAGEDRQLAIELIEALARPDRRARALPLAARMHRIGNVEMGDFARAFWYSLLGARPQAIAALGKWADAAPQGQRFNGLRFLWMPAFDPIRNDPGFKAVLRKMGLPYRPDTAETK